MWKAILKEKNNLTALCCSEPFSVLAFFFFFFADIFGQTVETWASVLPSL